MVLKIFHDKGLLRADQVVMPVHEHRFPVLLSSLPRQLVVFSADRRIEIDWTDC